MSTDVLETLRRLRRSLTRAAGAVFAESGVGTKQVGVLRELRRFGSISQVELARATATDPAALMRALDALERRGWLQRSSCDGDRRRKLVSLTDDGRRALADLDAGYDKLSALAGEPLSPAERKQFIALAGRIAAALEAAGANAPEET